MVAALWWSRDKGCRGAGGPHLEQGASGSWATRMHLTGSPCPLCPRGRGSGGGRPCPGGGGASLVATPPAASYLGSRESGQRVVS